MLSYRILPERDPPVCLYHQQAETQFSVQMTEHVEHNQGFKNEQSCYFLVSLPNLSSGMFAVDIRLPNGFFITSETRDET